MKTILLDAGIAGCTTRHLTNGSSRKYACVLMVYFCHADITDPARSHYWCLLLSIQTKRFLKTEIQNGRQAKISL